MIGNCEKLSLSVGLQAKLRQVKLWQVEEKLKFKSGTALYLKLHLFPCCMTYKHECAHKPGLIHYDLLFNRRLDYYYDQYTGKQINGQTIYRPQNLLALEINLSTFYAYEKQKMITY